MEAAGITPECRANSRPPRNTAIVGIARILNRDANSGRSSVFTLATIQRPDPLAATLATSGSAILHGPHHGAQKSTRTGSAE